MALFTDALLKSQEKYQLLLFLFCFAYLVFVNRFVTCLVYAMMKRARHGDHLVRFALSGLYTDHEG